MERRILNHYKTPGHATFYSGLSNTFKFWKQTYPKLTLKKVSDILAQNEGYTRHRQVKEEKTSPTYIYFKRDSIQLDLIDIRALSDSNDNFKWILSSIDCFTKMAQCEPLKSKTQDNVLFGFKEILKRFKQKPKSIYTDAGSEFGLKFKDYCNTNKIKIFYAISTKQKASMVERLNLTLKKMIYSYMTDKGSLRFIPHLQKIVKSYNSKIHSSLPNITPLQAEVGDEDTTFNIRQMNELKYLSAKKVPAKFTVGQKVRISTAKNIFSRGFKPQHQGEIFTVESVDRRLPRPRYRLTDYYGKEKILGHFTNNELQPVRKEHFNIEKILQTKTDRKGIKKHLVKFEDYREPEWILASQIVSKN